MKWSTLLLLGVVGCTKPNPALSCEDGLCSDPAIPYCDVNGTLGGEGPNTCIHVSCTPNDFAECRGDKALTCNSTGDAYDLLTCEHGCSADVNGCKPAPPCDTLDCQKHIVPRYLPTICDALATNAALAIMSATVIDTSDDTQCTTVVAQTSGPEICVRHHPEITIDRNVEVQIVGARAIAFVADTKLLVDGALDANGKSLNAAGHRSLVSGGTASNTIAGGGAGGRTAGGAGGSASGTGGAANGGAATANAALVTDLFGGARSDDNNNNGGGAITLIACRGVLEVPGVVDVGGGGGKRGILQQTTTIMARGGGAGGTLVLQGMQVTVTGQLFSNGGGGGYGLGGLDGQPGSRSTMPAQGGTGPNAANGGAGGALSGPTDGRNDGAVNGAGGGAAGFLLVYTPTTVPATVTPTAVSPSVEQLQSLATN